MTQQRRWRARVTGRPLQSGAREANGRLQRDPQAETQREIMATVRAQPHRRSAKPVPNGKRGGRHADDNRAAYEFGRLTISGEITQRQHDALAHWLEAYLRFARALNLPAVRYGSCLAVNIGGSSYDGDDPDPERTAARANGARRNFEALEAVMADGLGRELTEANVSLVHVVLMDREATPRMIGALRLVGNVIDKYRTVTGGSRVD